MSCMRRITLTIDDDLLKRLKGLAASQGKTLAALINELLRQSLAVSARLPPYKLDLEGWEAVEQSGVDLLNRDRLFDVMDGR